MRNKQASSSRISMPRRKQSQISRHQLEHLLTVHAYGTPQSKKIMSWLRSAKTSNSTVSSLRTTNQYVNWWTNKVAFIRCCDLDETADMRIVAGQETHAILHLALIHGVNATEEAIERSQQYSYVDFIDSVKKTLRLTRIVSFT